MNAQEVVVMRNLVCSMVGLLAASSLALGETPGEVVTAFNAALSDRDVEQAVSHIASGGLQFNLHAAHSDLASGEQPLSQDLAALWRVVSAVLAGSAESYRRNVSIDDSRVAGDIATVWTSTETVTQRASGAKPSRLAFSEVYLLLRREGVWKIAATANNRPPEATSRP